MNSIRRMYDEKQQQQKWSWLKSTGNQQIHYAKKELNFFFLWQKKKY